MKKTLLFVILTIASLGIHSQDYYYSYSQPTASKVQAKQVGNKIEIFYELNQWAGVAVRYKCENSEEFSPLLKAVSGDVGNNISAGSKRIVWNVLSEVGNQLKCEELVFEVIVVESDWYDNWYTNMLQNEDQARRADDEAWQAAKRANLIADYEDYINATGWKRHIEDAERAIEKLKVDQDNAAWAKACSVDTKDSYATYLNAQYAIHRSEANKRLNEIDQEEKKWQEIKNATDSATFENYIRDFPKSRQIGEAKQKLVEMADKAAWREAERTDTKDAYKAYSSKWTIFKDQADKRALLFECLDEAEVALKYDTPDDRKRAYEKAVQAENSGADTKSRFTKRIMRCKEPYMYYRCLQDNTTESELTQYLNYFASNPEITNRHWDEINNKREKLLRKAARREHYLHFRSFYPSYDNQMGFIFGNMSGLTYKRFINSSNAAFQLDALAGVKQTVGFDNEGKTLYPLNTYDVVLAPSFAWHFNLDHKGSIFYTGFGGSFGLANYFGNAHQTIDDFYMRGGAHLLFGIEREFGRTVVGLDFRPGYAAYFKKNAPVTHLIDWQLGMTLKGAFDNAVPVYRERRVRSSSRSTRQSSYSTSSSSELSSSGTTHSEATSHYLETMFGLGIETKNGNSLDYFVGGQYAYQHHVGGIFIDYMYGINSGESLFQVGPSFRLSQSDDAKMDVTLSFGPSFLTDFHSCYYGGNVGLRLAKRKDGFCWWGAQFGCSYLSNGVVMPSVSLSLGVSLEAGIIGGLVVASLYAKGKL